MPQPVELLGNFTAGEIGELLRARPDLSRPRPTTRQELAARASHAVSISAALRGLTAFKLAVVEVLCLLDPSPTLDEVAASMGATVEEVDAALATLRVQLLAFNDGGSAGLFPAVRRAVTWPAGTGPPLREAFQIVAYDVLQQIARNLGVRAHGRREELIDAIASAFRGPDEIGAVVAAQPAAIQQLIAKIGAAPNHLIGADQGIQWQGGRTYNELDQAQSVALLIPVGWNRLALSREVGVWCRHGRLIDVPSRPPMVLTDDVDAADARSAGGAAAQSVLAHLVTLLEECEQRPVAILKTGGIGVRELKRLGKRLDLPLDETGRLLELALAAELIGLSRKLQMIVPSKAADAWLDAPPGARWVRVVSGWMRTPRWPTLAGSEGFDGKPLPALGYQGNVDASRLRAEVVELLVRVGATSAASAASVSGFLRWQFPRRFEGEPVPFDEMIGWTLAEGALLGVTGLGAITDAGQLLHTGDAGAAERAAASMIPAPIASFAIQADLTAVVAGSLEPDDARVLSDMADCESAGGATVWRFSAATIRRAMDRGRSATELDGYLAARAAHGVPQTLTYLIADVARKHGHLRVTDGVTIVRGDDAALMTELVRNRKLGKLSLRLVAPTVAVTGRKSSDVLTALRTAGYLPVVEHADGQLGVTRPVRPRADVSLTAPLRSTPPAKEVDIDALAAELVDAPEDKDATLVDMIRDAIEGDYPVHFAYRDDAGNFETVVAFPDDVTDRVMRGETERGDRSFILDRIEWLERLVDD